MPENTSRVLIVTRCDRDRKLLFEAIAPPNPRAHVPSCLPEDLKAHLSTPFNAVVLDCTALENPADIIRNLAPTPVICMVDSKHKEVALDALRQGVVDVIVKDEFGLYLDIVPLKVQGLLAARPRHLAEAGAAGTPPLPGEYEQLAHSLFEHSPNMIFINAGGRVVYANHKSVELMGYSRQAFYAPDFNFLDLIAPECLDIVRLNWGRHLRGQDVDPYDYTLITKTGRRIEAVMASKLIQYRGQQAILGIITDISHRKRIEEQLTRARTQLEQRIKDRTEELVKTNESLLVEIKDRQRAEQALRQSEERYRSISSLTSDYVYALSCEEGYAVEWIAGAFEKITGYQPAEITTLDHWLKIVHPEDLRIMKELAEKCFSGKAVECEYRIRTRQGQQRWLQDHVHPVVDEQSGRVTTLLGAVRDITERKQALDALKESELKFKTIFDNAGGAIFIADTETGIILECNAEAEKLTGLPRSTLIGLHQTQIHPPEEAEKYAAKFRDHIAKDHLLDFESEIRHSDGRRIPVWISSQCLSFTDHRVLMGLFLDTSAKRRAEEQRVRLADILEEKNRELESIIHVASHDFRTPLITIAGFAGELQRSARQLEDLLASKALPDSFAKPASTIVSQDIPEAVGLITASTVKLNGLLDGLTRLARLDHPAMEMSCIDMNAMLEEILKTLTCQTRHRQVQVRIEPLPNCWGDEQQINQVFSNLLGNALSYLDPSRPGLVTATGRCTEDHTIYCIEDNGIGIDAHNLPHIFKMYYRVDPGKTEGQGLGLAIVRRILSRHNGKVWAESEEKRGSRFFVALPNP
ncbi:MAG: PAS domain S-box protein [Phycisphaerae bacterium]|nr:PAS domain S-box protein [Phycisphaerae bacterium]